MIKLIKEGGKEGVKGDEVEVKEEERRGQEEEE